MTTTAGKLSSSFTATPSVWTAYRASVCKYHIDSIKNESPVFSSLPDRYKKIDLNSEKGEKLKYNRILALYLKVTQLKACPIPDLLPTDFLEFTLLKKKRRFRKKRQMSI